jgi:hypothetical protein
MRRHALILALTALAAAPAAASAAQPERPPCDPFACPDPVQGVKDCASTAGIGKDPETGHLYLTGDCSTRDIIWG